MPKAELFQKAELFELARQVRNYRTRREVPAARRLCHGGQWASRC